MRRRPLPFTLAFTAGCVCPPAPLADAPAPEPGQPADGEALPQLQLTPGSVPSGLSTHAPKPLSDITAVPLSGPRPAEPLALKWPVLTSMNPSTTPEMPRTS